MLKKGMLSFAFLVLSLVAAAQTVYEFDYFFVDKHGNDEYKALMVRNGDGTGFIRVRYMDDKGKPVVVDMMMEEQYMGAEDESDDRPTDSTLLIFEGIDPQVVVGNKKEQYDPDVFVFGKNPQTGIYDPVSVISMGEHPKDDIEGTIRNFRLLNQVDMTEDFVLQYFTPKDDFYVNLFEASTRNITPEIKGARLHLILVANTEDKTIGNTCKIDKDATYKLFSELAEFLEIQFVPTVIFGNDFSRVNVDKAINAVQATSNDIIVFYYTGHGFSNMRDSYSYPFLDLRDKSYQTFGGAFTLNMEDIYQRIRQKGARFNLVISDCCNSDPTQTTQMGPDGATTRSSSVGWSKENCRALFMNPKPFSILATAATKGELSAGNSTGGIFTFNLRESLEKFIGVFYFNASWDALLESAKKQTIDKANHTWCKMPDNTKQVCKQHPVFKFN